MGIIEIAALILEALDLAEKIKEVADKVIPKPPDDLTEKHRWFQCCVKNETQFDLLLNGTYFDSGKFWTAPGSVADFSQMVYSGCDKDHSILTGVSGGMSFSTILDKTHTFSIAVGFSAPEAGGFKAGVIESESAKDGYEKATDEGNSLISANRYKAKDKDGNPVEIEFHVSAYPGSEMSIVVTEVRLID